MPETAATARPGSVFWVVGVLDPAWTLIWWWETCRSMQNLIRARGFEPPASWSRTRIRGALGEVIYGQAIRRSVDARPFILVTDDSNSSFLPGWNGRRRPTKSTSFVPVFLSMPVSRRISGQSPAWRFVTRVNSFRAGLRGFHRKPGARSDGRHAARRVSYYRPEDLPGNVWALPDLITTTKLKRFEYQAEYRFAYTTTDAFAFRNCIPVLVDRKARPLPKPEEHHHKTLDPGDLRDICKLHEY